MPSLLLGQWPTKMHRSQRPLTDLVEAMVENDVPVDLITRGAHEWEKWWTTRRMRCGV